MANKLNVKLRVYLSLFCWCTALLLLSFGINRADFPIVFLVYGVAFGAYFLLCEQNLTSEKIYTNLLIISILVRLIIVFAFPFFSDDIYRFWWDGKLIVQGINPFAETPRFYIENQIFIDDFTKNIFAKLNSPDYYSVYPPVCQTIFSISFWLSPTSIYGAAIVIKSFILLCEIGTILLLKKMASPQKTLLYAINPLIIIELCGNAHFEAAMIFFFICCLYIIFHKKINLIEDIGIAEFRLFFNPINNQKLEIKWLLVAAFCLALSVASKLLTLIFLPFIFKKLGLKRGLFFAICVGFFIALLFLPFWHHLFLAHFSESLNLYFQKFEFNASLYYTLRLLGKSYYGYSPTIQISIVLKICTIGTLAYFFFKKGQFYHQLFLFFTCYLLFQSTVHPWYLSTLVLLSVFVPFRYGIMWSGVIILSYIHYWNNQYQENYVAIILEYALLLACFLYERNVFFQK